MNMQKVAQIICKKIKIKYVTGTVCEQTVQTYFLVTFLLS